METTVEKLEAKKITFVAVEVGNDKHIIAQGFDANEVVKKAEKSGIAFRITYKFNENYTFIF